MKKVIGAIAALIFGLFCLGMIGQVLSLTYGALQKIFVTSSTNQMWGLVNFDIAMIAWGLGFIYKSRSVGQYGAAGAGFLVALLGTIAMIYAEVSLESAGLTGNTNTQELGQWMVRIFIIASIVHLILIYIHHATSPELSAQISTGVAKGVIIDKAHKDAERQLERETAALAQDITADIVASVRRDLQLPIPAEGTVFQPKQLTTEAPALPQPDAITEALATGQYNHLRPPGGNPNHSDLQPGVLPLGIWQRILQEWDAYHDERIAALKQQKEPGEKPSPFLKSQPE